MATFQERIEDLIGTVGDTAAESDWLTEGAKVVINTVDPEKLELYATDKTDSGTGIDITNGKPIDAHKSGHRAKLYSASMKAMLSDADSIHYALATSPAWYKETSKGYVLPSGGIIRWVAYPAVISSASTIAAFPPEGYHAIILYAAIMGQIRKITDLISTTMAGITFTISNTLPIIAVPSFTYTKPVFSGVYTDIATALTNQDVELARGHGEKVSLYLQQYSVDIQNELNEFNASVQEYQSTLGKYNAEVGAYQAQVQKEVGRVQSVIQQYVSMYQGYFELLKNLREELKMALSTL